jgi:hypothetical protein
VISLRLSPLMARGQARLKTSFAICERREARMNGRIALGEYGEQLAAEIEKKIAEEVERLRADMNLKRASDDGEVVLLPVSRE